MSEKTYTEDIRDDGIVEGGYQGVETQYVYIEGVHAHPEDPNTICFTHDAPGYFTQIRIRIEDLKRIVGGDYSGLNQSAEAINEAIAALRGKP